MASTERDVRPPFEPDNMKALAGDDPDGASEPLLPHEPDDFPFPTWTLARRSKSRRKLPQAIAHRGYKAKYPENTMASMKGAVDVGTHALETDIHLSKDGVVVLSHDPTLKRCFGLPDKIIDCEWSYLSTLRTTGPQPEPMPRLRDLLEYVAQPGLEDLWVLLDVKLDNDPHDAIRLIGSTIAAVPAAKDRPWNERIVLGIWATKYLPLCAAHLPSFPLSYIGFSTRYARQFLVVPNVSFNMLQFSLMGPIGNRFIRDVQSAHRPIFAWTVNEEKKMRWGIRKGLDGIVTDDPKKFLEVCREVEERGLDRRKERMTWKEVWTMVRIQLLVLVFWCYFRWKFDVHWGVDKRFVRRGQQNIPVLPN